MIYIDPDVLYAESGYAPESGLLLAELDTEEEKLWELFKSLHIDNCSYFQDRRIQDKEAEASIDAHHPFVPFLSNFALSAYNKLCRMFYKKDEKENIYDAQVTSVRYSYIDYGFIFFVTLEALEDNVVGVYEATVICHIHQGLRALIKFTHLLHTPIGSKYKGMTYLIHEKLISELVKEKKEYLESFMGAGDFPPNSMLKKEYEAYEGACRIFDKYALQLNQTSRKIKKRYSGEWLFPNEKSGLQRRSTEHTFGYDYVNPLEVFSNYTSMKPLGCLYTSMKLLGCLQ